MPRAQTRPDNGGIPRQTPVTALLKKVTEAPGHLYGLARTRIPRGKTPVFVGAGLALVGVGFATAIAGGATPSASAGATSAARVAAISGATPGGSAAGSTGSSTGTGHSSGAGKSEAAGKSTGAGKSAGGGAAQASPASTSGASRSQATSWEAVVRSIAARSHPGLKPGSPIGPADRMHPVGYSGAQNSIPMTQAQWDNARTIVNEAINRHMGLRAAVIAVATSMQESKLMNLQYGDRDSLGLFQQRPSAGWGSPQQILNPVYSAGAFLDALRSYQANDPGWATQPLWQAAQGVQRSAFPYAYAQWEAQASSIVGTIATQMAH